MFSAVKYFQQIIFSEKYDFFENILWHLVFTKIHQWPAEFQLLLSDSDTNGQILAKLTGIWHSMPNSGQFCRNMACRIPVIARIQPMLSNFCNRIPKFGDLRR